MSTEIRLMLDDPELFAQQLKHAANHWDDGGPSSPIGLALHAASRQISDQLPKHPAPHMEAFAQIGRIAEAYVQAHAEAGRRLLVAFGAIKDLRQDDFVLVPGPVEEQVEPSAVEPTAFGSIVRAGFDEHSDRILWQRGPKAGWNGEDGSYQGFYDALHDPEVLRVGVGGDDAPPTCSEHNYSYCTICGELKSPEPAPEQVEVEPVCNCEYGPVWPDGVGHESYCATLGGPVEPELPKNRKPETENGVTP